MKDQHTIERIALFHPKVRSLFTAFVDDCEAALGIVLRCAEGFRTFEEQEKIWNRGRDSKGHIINESAVATKSPPGSSYHNYGLAGDFAPIIFDEKGNPSQLDWKYDFSLLVPFAEKHGISWGGNFISIKDIDHFENRMGYNWRDLLHKYLLKDFIPGTNYVNI